MTVTLLDAILIGIMLISALLAMVRGFSREVLSVLSWLAAAAAAFFFYKPLTPYVQQYVDSETVAMGIAGLAIFFVTLVIVSFITLRIADFIIDSRIGALDRTLGFLFGAARGLALVVVAMLFFNWLAPQNQPTWIAEARSKPFLDDLGARLIAVVPERPEDLLPEQIREKLDRPATAETGVSEPTTIEGAIQGSGPAEGGAAGEVPDDSAAPTPAN